MTPSPYVFALLTLAAFRTWKLIGEDAITEPLRKPLTGKAQELVECPWCLGTWVAFGWVGAWWLWPHAATIAAVPLALAAAAGLTASVFFRLSDS